MGRAKDIVLKVIPAGIANAFIKRWHYSGKVVQNSSLHFGAFLDGELHGVMSFGSPLDKRKVLPLVAGTLWNEMLELNRMAFDDVLPKNSESRCIAIAIRLLKRNAPQVKWILSFADGMQCGDGAIYRASGFLLTGVSEGSMWVLPKGLAEINGGPVAHRMKVQDKCSALSKYILGETSGKNLTMNRYAERFGGHILPGQMLRYIYLIDKKCELSCPVLPFAEIDRIGAGMYRGEKITLAERREKGVQSIEGDVPGHQSGEGGSIPT